MQHNLNDIEAELCKRSFYYFVQTFWSTIISEDPVWNWHIKFICDEFQSVIERIAKRKDKVEDIIVNIPPGTSKSTICTIMLPAWAWIIDPSLRVLTISYSEDLATEHAVKSRDIIESDQYRSMFPQVNIKKDKNNKTNYENTNHGQRRAAGLSGSITGIHAHLILIDDPLNPKQAASDQECANANAMIDSTLSTRKVNKKVTVTAMIMQRLSENDPTGHLLSKKGKKVRHICLPAETRDGVKPVELAANYVDGLLDPIRLAKKELDEAVVDLGTSNYAGQFAQRPAPAGGAIWQRWFIQVPDEQWPTLKQFTQYGTDWDLAYTKIDDNAASAYVTAGKIKNNIYIADIGWDWLEFPPLIKWMKTKPEPHYIEAKASGKSAKQTLTMNGIPAIEVQVKGGDKIARAKMATPVAEAGMVFIKKSIAEKLYDDPKQGILSFPRGKFKDLADTLAQALQRLGKKGGLVVSGSSEESLLEDVEFED